MNKALIIVLAICLVSVHAFVKRDAAAAETKPDKNGLDEILNDLKKSFGDAGDKLKDALNPDNVKKQLEDALGKINTVIEDGKKYLHEGEKKA